MIYSHPGGDEPASLVLGRSSPWLVIQWFLITPSIHGTPFSGLKIGVNYQPTEASSRQQPSSKLGVRGTINRRSNQIHRAPRVRSSRRRYWQWKRPGIEIKPWLATDNLHVFPHVRDTLGGVETKKTTGGKTHKKRRVAASWWLNQASWNWWVKMGSSSPSFGMKTKKYLKAPTGSWIPTPNTPNWHHQDDIIFFRLANSLSTLILGRGVGPTKKGNILFEYISVHFEWLRSYWPSHPFSKFKKHTKNTDPQQLPTRKNNIKQHLSIPQSTNLRPN